MAYLWRAYFRLRRRKNTGFNGLNKIEWPDIDAFIRRAMRLAPWEVAIIEDLDDVFCRVMAEAQEPSESEAQQATKDSVESVAKRTVVVQRGEAVHG